MVGLGRSPSTAPTHAPPAMPTNSPHLRAQRTAHHTRLGPPAFRSPTRHAVTWRAAHADTALTRGHTSTPHTVRTQQHAWTHGSMTLPLSRTPANAAHPTYACEKIRVMDQDNCPADVDCHFGLKKFKGRHQSTPFFQGPLKADAIADLDKKP